MTVKLSSIDIAKLIISQGIELDINDISPLKLQKLLFLAYKKHKELYETPLFSGNFLVWKHGPVNLEVYNAYKSYGSDIIRESSLKSTDNCKVKKTIEDILTEYGNISAWDLVDITHKKDGIWYKKMCLGEGYIEYSDF